MSLTTMDVPFCSSTRVSGSGVYTSATLECNWNEDRVRLDAGEYVYMPLMEGAQVRPEETDISIAPPTRDRGKASDGRLVMPHRSMRSRATQDSSRFVTDDGYRVTLSTHLNDYTPIGERVGAVQVDDLSKTRTGGSMREKNSQLEPNRVQDGEAKIVDEFSGRVLDGRRWGGGLHQSVEAKEQLEVQPETETIASVTYQALFRLFPKLSAMSGTALTEAEEFATFYDLQVAESARACGCYVIS